MPGFQLPPISNHKLFEQLLADLLNEYYNTISFKCFGKSGHRQKGIDVFSSAKAIAVQCKHKDLSKKSLQVKKELLNEIEKTLLEIKQKKTPIPISELIIASTATEHPDYDEYIAELKSSHQLKIEICFWGWDTIQEKLSHSPKTLEKYYPHFKNTTISVEEMLVSKLAMKNKIEKDFAPWLNYNTENRQFRSRMIIHSVSDKDYPKHTNENGPWFWFRADIDRMTTKGLAFIDGITSVYLNSQKRWTLEMPKDLSGFREVKVARVNVIALEDIVDYDLNGDEFYPFPHFYVKFNEDDSPYSEIYYQRLEDDFSLPMYFEEQTSLDV